MSLSILLVLALTPMALAQTAISQPQTQETGRAASASESTSAPSANAGSPSPPPAPPAQPSGATSIAVAPLAAPAAERWDITDTKEDPAKTYKFIGLRYRGNWIPKWMENIFVSEGKDIYSNNVGLEFDIRKGGQSVIPWIQYSDYSTGNILFWQKGTQDTANNYSVVNSGLKAIYVGLDELWSVPVVAGKLDFEYGFGVGMGAVFGDLRNGWVYDSGASGPLTGSNGHHYTPCPSTNAGFGCSEMDHSNAAVAKVSGYIEPNWFGGGSVPVIFPHIAIPQFSLRYKPIKQLETRFSLGFQLTGLWFGISADYGLEQRPDPGAKTGGTASPRGTL
ncbi:MAG: hypothetical protein ABSC94_14595 [Polyangiaceae bacterium]|jgi:hypothetical protein